MKFMQLFCIQLLFTWTNQIAIYISFANNVNYVYTNFETSPNKYVYSRTVDSLLTTLPFVSYTAGVRNNNAVLI